MNLNLDDFPDSPYARELRRGVAGLRFHGPLEAEYSHSHLGRVQLRVRALFSLTTVLAVLFTVDQVRRTGVGSMPSLVHLGVLMPCIAALLWLAWSRHYQRYYLATARILVPFLWALIAMFIARALVDGRNEQLAGLAVNVIAVFFFAGLMFRQALVTCAITLIAFVVAAVAVGLPDLMIVKSMVVLTLTAIIGAIVYRDVEQSYRLTFLEGALIKQLVARDGLSGLMNRRAFDEHLLRVWQHALRDQRTIAIVMIDVDHFKRYNDTFGHQAGDVALRRVADVIGGFARRPLDLAARYGGEEFAVILYDLAPSHVQDMAERLRQRVQNLQISPHKDGIAAQPDVTVSVGVGVAEPTIGRTPQGAVQLADEALYEAKHAGRNCVVVKGAEAYRGLDTGDFKSPRFVRRHG
jgi:diguanylate cyclase (GGDEF)-like protein